MPLSPAMKRAITALLITILFLPQTSFRAGLVAVPFSLFAIYALIGVMLARDFLKFDPWQVVAWAIVMIAVLASTVVNRGSSIPSAGLLGSIYLPFLFVNRFRGGDEHFLYVARKYSNLMGIIAVVACVQFLLQFVTEVPWVLSIRPLIPPFIQHPGHFNTFAFSGELFRSNGYFLLEPSFLSIYAGLALMCEIMLFRRKAMLGLHVAALMAAWSGSGILIVIVGLLPPLLARAPIRAIIGAAIAVPLVPIIATSLGMSSLLGRLTEFSRPGSSGYARFVAPVAFIAFGWMRAPWSLALGNGPGSILRAIHGSNSTFEIFNPTWAKIIYEYGVVGSVGFAALMLSALSRRSSPPALRIALFYMWIATAENVLNVDIVGLLMLLGIFWRKDPPAPPAPAPVPPAMPA